MLQQLNHQDGNNYEAVKTKRISFLIAISTAQINPRFYFPDIPELNNVQIVGIEAHFGQSPNQFFDGDIWYFLNNNNTPWDPAIGALCFVNLINSQNELIIANFPATGFYNAQANKSNNLLSQSDKSGKIIPVYAKLNLRQSYIYFNNISASGYDQVATFTFYHLGKQ
jgi:hypothetical protein